MKTLLIVRPKSFWMLICITLMFAWPEKTYGSLVAAWGQANGFDDAVLSGLTNVKAVAGGSNFSLILHSDGTVTVTGLSDARSANVFNVPPGLSNVIDVAAGANHALALTGDGTVKAWGYGIFGETAVPPDLSNVVAVAAGSAHSLALRSDGTVVAWGTHFGNQINVPAGLKDVKSIAAGGSSMALRHDGTVVVWSGHSNVPASLNDVSAIASGSTFNLALKADGTVVGWGNNTDGQLDIPSSATNIIAIAAGFAHAVALRADGAVIAWGRNVFGQTDVPVGLTNVTAIAAGVNHTLALTLNQQVQILRHPRNQEVLFTSNAVFSVAAIGAPPLTYQWYRNGDRLNDGARYTGATAAIFTISNAQFSDAGNFSVTVSNKFGAVNSSNATLTVISPPFITSQPEDRTVGAGTGVSLSVSFSGTPPLAYQWSLNGTNLPGRTSSSLFISDVQAEHSGVYSVMASNVYGIASTNMTLTVTNTAPYFSQQPFITTTNFRNQVTSPFPEGTSVALNVFARGSRPLSYQWRFNGSDILGTTNSTLLLSHLSYGDAGYYSVDVSNAFGWTNSMKLLVDVSQILTLGTPFTGNTNLPLGLSGLTSVAAGGSHIMALRPNGTVGVWMANPSFVFGTPSSVTNVPATATNVMAMAAGRDHCVVLRSNGTVVAWGGNNYGQTNVPQGLSNVVGIAAGHFRSFAVRAEGKVNGWGSQAQVPGDLSNVAAIAAGPLQNLALKHDGTVAAWGSSSLASVPPGLSNVIAIAAGSHKNIALRSDGTVATWSNPAGFSNVLDGNHVLSNAVAISAGSGVTLILKQDGTISATGFDSSKLSTLTNAGAVSAGGIGPGFGVVMFGVGAPRITLQPYSQIVSPSNVVQLHSRAVGLQPMNYQWQLDNEDIPGATNASLLITNMQGQHTGAYRMLASNALGSVFSATAQLAILFNTKLTESLNATNFVWDSFSSTSKTQNLWFPQIRETHDGEAAAQSGAISHNQQSHLQTTVTGPGTLTFWWKVSSEAGYDHLRFNIDHQGIPLAMISGEVGWEKRTFSIPQGVHVLRWTYSKDGTVSSGRDAGWLDEVVFTHQVPTIIRHPFDKTVLAGANVTLSALAESALPMTYQWLKNGTNLPGATSKYLTLTNVTLDEAGNYAIRVSNAGGSVTSSNATLTVLVSEVSEPLQILPDGSAMLWSRVESMPEEIGALKVQASTNFLNWTTLPGAPVFTNGWLRFHDTNSIDFPMRFYRIVEH